MNSVTSAQVIARHKTLVLAATEGGTGPDEITFFLNLLARESSIRTILEIGFNAGLLATAFLSARPDITVISVDIGSHDYVLKAKEWIDKEFPNRHMLLIGDSTKVLPQLMEQFPAYRPDLIFVDGGHEEPVPRLDIDNAIKLARPDTFILDDDVVPWMNDIMSALDRCVKSHRLHLLEQGRSDIWGWALFKKLS
jgi:predicted O-methyltransferase YrrM